MYFRSRKLDCFRYNFARFTLASIFIVGSLLLLCSFIDSKSSHVKEIGSSGHTRSTRNVSEHLHNLRNLNELLFQNQKTTEAGDRWKILLEEDFPQAGANPSVASVLKSFHKKIALHDRKLVNRHDFNYVHNVPNACSGRKVELMVGVPTRTDSFDARQAIRETWGDYSKDLANNAVVLFVLGGHIDQHVQEKIDAEFSKYGDIIQEDFVDSYRNLSLKTVALMKWVTIYCAESTFVLKADDDMYINMPRLLMKLREQLSRGPMFIFGAVHQNTAPFRDRRSKWFVTKEEYSDKSFPNYVSGTAYAMTTTAAMRLYVESLYVTNLFLEDVYLTGLVADKAAVPRVSEADFTWAKLDPEGCNFKDKISGHRNTPDDIRKIHKELFDPNLRCAFE